MFSRSASERFVNKRSPRGLASRRSGYQTVFCAVHRLRRADAFWRRVRQKILEAWSMKRPVVATSMAVEGLDVQLGAKLWLEDTPETFADRVVEVLEGPAVNSGDD